MPKTIYRKLAVAFIASVCLGAYLQSAGQTATKHSAKPAPKPEEHTLAHDVRHQIQVLPYYSVFDYIAFTLDGSKVTLTGQVVRPKLRADAEATVKSMEGVSSVNNLIEVLPKSPADDELRRKVYRAIFEDSVLQRYAVSDVPAIHIILKDASVTLEGTVASEGDKKLAAARAASVEGVSDVKNNLAFRDKNIPAN